MTIRLQLLGAVALTDDTAPASTAAPQRQGLALLAILAVHAVRGVTRERIGALLWPESDEEAARNRLRQAVYTLRRTLGSDAILGTHTLRLNVDKVGCDLADFERSRAHGDLDASVTAYGGPFLDGFQLGGDSPEFDRWVAEERSRLARAFADDIDALAVACETRGDHRRALARWRRLAAIEPLNGRSARGIIASLAATGDRAGAFRHAAEYRRRLKEGTGLPLDPELDALVAQLQRAEPIADVSLVGARDRAPESRRRSMAIPGIAAALTVLGASVALARCGERLAPPAFDPRRVAIATLAAGGGDAAGRDFRRLVAEGIAQRLTAPGIAASTQLLTNAVSDPRQAAMDAGAGLVLVLRRSEGAGPPRVSMELADVTTGQEMWSSAPMVVPVTGIAVAVDGVAERAATAVAVRLDPKLSAWIGRSGQPTTLAAYTEFRRGIDLFIDFNWKEAKTHFEIAARDSEFAVPLVMAAWAEYYGGEALAARTMSERLASRELTLLDRALVEEERAVFRSDLAAAYERAREVVAAAPNSEWRYLLAETALQNGHGHEAVRLLEAMGPDAGWTQGYFMYWARLSEALHFIGDHEGELVAMEEAERRMPTNRGISQLKLKALAASGHVAEVDAELDRALSIGGPEDFFNQPMQQTMMELRAHGHPEAARRVAERMLAWIDHLPAGDQDVRDGIRDDFFEEAGRWREARAIFGRLAEKDPNDLYSVEKLGALSAKLGDTATARRIGARFERMARPLKPEESADLSYYRALLAASLGEREEAVRLLRDSYRNGNPFRFQWHLQVEFSALRGYPPFEAFIRPVD